MKQALHLAIKMSAVALSHQEAMFFLRVVEGLVYQCLCCDERHLLHGIARTRSAAGCGNALLLVGLRSSLWLLFKDHSIQVL